MPSLTAGCYVLDSASQASVLTWMQIRLSSSMLPARCSEEVHDDNSCPRHQACSSFISCTYLTERMHPIASTGYFFHLRNGRSTEYAMPSSRLPTSVANNGAEPMYRPSSTATRPVPTATLMPVFRDQSPEARGRYGLLILSMSTSKIWFMPTMQIFISRAGTKA